MRTRDIIIICVTLLMVSVLLGGSLVAVFWPGEYRYETLTLRYGRYGPYSSGQDSYTKDTLVRINRLTGKTEYLSNFDGRTDDRPKWRKLPK